jgi:hypothetical protein
LAVPGIDTILPRRGAIEHDNKAASENRGGFVSFHFFASFAVKQFPAESSRCRARYFFICIFSGFGQIQFMSDKQLALDSIERLPADASLDVIAERVDFLAAIRKGLNQIELGETIPHEEVKRQLAAWLAK